jgi:hypothetical protein
MWNKSPSHNVETFKKVLNPRSHNTLVINEFNHYNATRIAHRRLRFHRRTCVGDVDQTWVILPVVDLGHENDH